MQVHDYNENKQQRSSHLPYYTNTAILTVILLRRLSINRVHR